ncbi:nuclear transport factor 2 family protein [Micromonospora sp. NPDC049559]|uniref:nuclear transport factor 2 family protein n=1 Tax=Micromonospora sp. NPDC049559 TaxID=3155923 RepID=UPI0034433997
MEQEHPNLALVDRFFASYLRRDLAALRALTTTDVRWHFPGPPPLGGEKRGIEEIVAFLDEISTFAFQERCGFRGVNDDHLVEYKRTTRADDGRALDWCVVWTFRAGRISAGAHFVVDAEPVGSFFRR